MSATTHQDAETNRRTGGSDKGGIGGLVLLGRIMEKAGVNPDDFVQPFLLTVGNQQEVRDWAENEVLRLALAIITEEKHHRNSGADYGDTPVSATIEQTKARIQKSVNATEAAVDGIADKLRAEVAARKVLPSNNVLADILESVRKVRKQIAAHHS